MKQGLILKTSIGPNGVIGVNVLLHVEVLEHNQEVVVVIHLEMEAFHVLLIQILKLKSVIMAHVLVCYFIIKI